MVRPVAQQLDVAFLQASSRQPSWDFTSPLLSAPVAHLKVKEAEV